MGKLTTHILDTSMGTPAKEVEIKLYKRNDSSLKLINSAKTNEDGRCNEPLSVRKIYLKRAVMKLNLILVTIMQQKILIVLFLKDVVIRFYISNSDENYHVPLLISPFSYSTYRGS